jgi:hypothetical protein
MLMGVCSMKKLALLFFLLQSPMLFAATSAPGAADFPVKVHVVFSRYVSSAGYQQIEAIIDGERVELVAFSQGFLALGDYQARVSTKIHGPKNPNTYDVYKGYDFLIADGKIRTYQVTAVGESEFPAAPPPVPPAPSDTPAPPPPLRLLLRRCERGIRVFRGNI